MTATADAPAHGFPRREFETRLDRAQRIMHRDGLDALLATTPQNVRYFTGLDTQFWESATRPWFVVVPAAGEPVAVVPTIGAPGMARTWISDIRTWPAPVPEDDGVSLLAAALGAVPRRFGRIGAELGRETALRMPVLDFLRLREAVAGEIVDGAPTLRDARMVKTDAEIARIRHVCALAGAAYAALPGRLSPGRSERDAARALRVDLAERGADASPFLPAISGPGGVAQIVCGPGDRVLEDGDVLFLDTGSTFDGYFCDFDRTYAVGHVPAAVARAHALLWRATEAGIAAAVPGARTDDVWRAMARVLGEAGAAGGGVGRFGHGVGLGMTEPPSLRPGDGTVLAEGMVLAIEPGFAHAPGRMLVHEENVVVTASGAALLTPRAPREMPVIR